jgi:hypothetical protein
MIDLRPLIVVTGTVRIEGGEKNTVRQQRGSTRRTDDGTKLVVVHEVRISDDRKKADVVTTGYARRVQHIRILKTPFGSLIDPKNLDKIKEMINKASAAVAEFNRGHKATKLSNCMLWETLKGNRLDAIRGWIDRRLVEKDQEVKDALPLLVVDASVKGAA